MSECLCENGKLPPSEALAKHDDNGSSLRRVCERSTNKRAIRRGKPDRPVGCWKSMLRVGVLRSQHRLSSQLGNGMPLDLADALCGDSPDRADIGKLCLTAINESIPAAYDVGRTLV